MARIRKHDYMTSLRIPSNWKEWFSGHSEKFQVPISYFYRKSLYEYMQRNQVGVAK